MTYLSTILADNPLHYWRLADGASAINYDLGSTPFHLAANDPVLNGGYTGIDALAGSMFSNSGNGVSQSVDTMLIASPITIEGWLWRQAVNAAEATIIACNDGTLRFGLFVEANGAAGFRSNNSGLVTAANAVTTQHWHHLALTYAPGVQIGYLDGVQVATNGPAGATSSQCQVSIGLQPGNVSVAHGFIAECAIYGAVLSAARIAAHFAAATLPQPVPIGGITGGSFSVTTGFAALVGPQLDQILQSVRKVY